MLFGATGDLAKRKLLPGMAYLVQSSLAPKIRVVGTSLEDLTDDEFRALTKEAVEAFGTHKLTEEQWAHFSARITYVPQSAGRRRWPRRSPQPRASWGPKRVGCTIFRCHPRLRVP